MDPSKKSPSMEEFLEHLFGRTTAITSNHCVPKPMGCGGPIMGFKDERSEREYTISGLCQNCQDEVFSSRAWSNDEEEDNDA